MMTQADIYAFLSESKLAVLSTLGPSNLPQSALIGIAVTPELEIIFDTVKHSRKYPNLVSTPACSLVIGWTGERTVQYEGRAEELGGTELARYQEIYFTAWPDGPARQSWPGIVYFVVRPRWLRYSDYDRTPPESELSFE